MKRIFFRSRTVAAAVGAVCLVVAVSGEAIAAGAILGDSFNQFAPGSPGSSNWEYGYYTTPGDPSTFTPLSRSETTSGHGLVVGGLHRNVDPMSSIYYSPWVSDDTQYSFDYNGAQSTAFWSVRRWSNTSGYVGSIEITGEVQDVNGFTPNDGTIGRIFIDGLEITPTLVENTTQNTSATPASGDGIQTVAEDLLEYTAQGNIGASSFIDFALDHNFTTEKDSTRLTGVIRESHATASVPTPALLPGLVGFGANLLRKRRKQSRLA